MTTVDDDRAGEPDATMSANSTGTARRRLLIVAAAVCIGVLIGVFAMGGLGDRSGGHEAAVSMFPEGRLTTLDGAAFDLAELRGTPTVVNFFASFCAPCRTEMPALQEVSERRSDVRIVGVNIDLVRQRDDAIALVESTGVTYTVLADPAATLMEALGNTLLPFTVFVAADGSIVEANNGMLQVGALDKGIDELVSG